MLDLFKRVKASSGRKSEGDNGAGISVAALADLIDSFPIGKRLQYYPEYKSDIKLDSILIGYLINGRQVFGAVDIRVQREDDTVQVFLTDGNGGEKAVRKVTDFAFVLPDANADDQLDYIRRAELDRVGCFRPGNNITLISSRRVDGAFTLDTEVRRAQVLRGGIYANHRIALLEPMPDTLTFTEQRLYQRVEVEVPVTLRTQRGEQQHDGTLLDFSENSMRIGFTPDSELVGLLREGRQMVLTLSIGADGPSYVIEGGVRRSGSDSLILDIRRMQKGGRFVAFNMSDALDIKARLLDLRGG